MCTFVRGKLGFLVCETGVFLAGNEFLQQNTARADLPHFLLGQKPQFPLYLRIGSSGSRKIVVLLDSVRGDNALLEQVAVEKPVRRQTVYHLCNFFCVRLIASEQYFAFNGPEHAVTVAIAVG